MFYQILLSLEPLGIRVSHINHTGNPPRFRPHPLQDVAHVMGHSPNVLLSTYAHVLSGSQDRITAAISAHVGKDLSPGRPALRAVGE